MVVSDIRHDLRKPVDLGNHLESECMDHVKGKESEERTICERTCTRLLSQDVFGNCVPLEDPWADKRNSRKVLVKSTGEIRWVDHGREPGQANGEEEL